MADAFRMDIIEVLRAPRRHRLIRLAGLRAMNRLRKQAADAAKNQTGGAGR